METLDRGTVCMHMQPGDGEWRFWRAWSLYNIHDFPPSNILWGAMPSQVGNGLASLSDGTAPGTYSSSTGTRRMLNASGAPSAMRPQAGKLLALFFVVAFGSSMDIAAIQADSPRDLDYNSELVTVGACSWVLEAGLEAGLSRTCSLWHMPHATCMPHARGHQGPSLVVCAGGLPLRQLSAGRALSPV